MAINLDVSNSINSAYAAGQALARQRKTDAEKLAQDAIDNEARQQQIDAQKARDAEAIKQHSELLKQNEEQFNANHELAKSQLKMQQLVQALGFKKFTEEGGGAAPGFDQTGQSMGEAGGPVVETSPGVFENVSANSTYSNKDSGISYAARNPEAVAAQNAKLGQIARAPLQAEERANYLFKGDYERRSAELALNQKATAEEHLKTIELAHDTAIKEAEYRNNLDVQKLRNEGMLDNTNDKNANKQTVQFWTRNLLDPEAQKEFNAPAGSTWQDVLGNVELDAKGKEKFLAYSKLEPQLLHAQELLDQKDPKTGKTGYQEFFLGGLKGRSADLFKNITGSTPFVNSIRPSLANVFLTMKDEANLGSALTKNESEFLKGYVPGNERNITPDEAKHIIDNLIPTIRQNRIETVKTYGKGHINTNLKPTGGWSIVP